MSALAFALLLTTLSLQTLPVQQDERIYDDDSKKTVQGLFRDPVLIKQTLPQYTDQAVQAKVEGTIRLQVVIRKDGSLDSFEILQPLGYGLDQAAVREIAANWEFSPATLNGEPVDYRAVIDVTFTIRSGPPKPEPTKGFPLKLQFGTPLTVQLPLIDGGVIQEVFSFTLLGSPHPAKRKLFELHFESGDESWTQQEVGRWDYLTFHIPAMEQGYSFQVRKVGKEGAEGRLIPPPSAPAPAAVDRPAAVRQSLPPYTPEARQAEIEGVLRLQFVVRKDGSIDSVEVVQPLGYGMDEAAVREVSQNWEFRPGTLDGKPHDFMMNVKFNFKLPSK